MDAKATTLLKFFEENQNNQFVIPIYQRLYSWKKEQCEQLWDDIIKIGGNDKANGHFIGSILYVRVDDTHSSSLLIIDGQQRLTTITLLLIALRNRSSEEVEILEKFSRKKVESYLINSNKDGDKKFRLILSESDKDTLLSLIDENRRKPSEPSLKIVENFKLFEEWIRKNTDKLETIFKGLEKLMIVWIALKKEKDDPQLIFESMNSTGKDLTQTDLIRNYIIMETEVKKQEDFYNQYWRAMEKDFKQNETLFNRFVRHYLTIKTREIPNINKVYEAFKDYQQKEGIEIEDLLKDLQKYCGYFCQIAFKKEADKDLNKALSFLVDLEMDVIYPLLLELYSDYKDGILSKQDFIPIIYLTESYICRRAVCGLGTNSLNKVFPSFTKHIQKDEYFKSLKAHFGYLTEKQRFPNNDEFKEHFITIDFYHFQKKEYFLERLENFERKERVYANEYTTEHIMPQTLEEEWERDLGENFKAIHEKYLHTIGNLTLTGYNEKYSNNSFQEKRDMEKGFKQSPLRLNQSLKDLEVFGEKEIEKRANDLADWALKIWTYPKLEVETLEKYKPKKEKKEKKEKEEYKLKKEKKVYDLSSYKFSPHSRELFDILREKIKAFDERITEKFMKHYITYKHDTIFASIAPLKSELNLNLKMDFSELQDEIKEKLKIRDVSNIGHLGIVSKKVKVVEVKLETKEDIPYCLGLIKQALEKQMGGRNRQ
ncbi:GmrSD restriction endonuclease domain-containing protein [Helicobacter pylori]|uniref:GmrSD restriction endonuclease domain-containing protein n=2 Tax=Helicobacter pylori TaxID=210 RepID=UPI00356A8F91